VLSDVRLSDENEPFRIIAAPVTVDGSTRVALVGASLEATDEAVDRVRDALVGGGAIAVLLTGVGAWFLAAAALRPVERMRREAADISEHDTAARLEVPAGRDEIAALGTTMNQLLTRLQDALARQRTFVGDASHELRTPLAVLRAELELAARPQRSTPELREAIAHAVVETNRVIRLADELLFLAEGDADQQVVHREDRSVRDVIQHSLGRIEPRAAARGVRLVTDLRDDRRARVDPGLLQRALDNLLENAVRYAPAGSTVTVHADRDGDRLAISVLDEGPGFPPEFLPHAFERFRRADDGRARSDGGSGLGLAIVLAVARAHGGTARAGNRASRGGAVTLELPDV
jgi:heavy metal sensor kinase